MSIEKLLHEEIVYELENLKGLEDKPEEHKATVDGVIKLMDRAIELEKLDIEQQDKDREHELKLEQMKEDKKDRLIRNILSGVGIVLPVGVTIWGTLKSLKFEETGTVTTIMGRGFINKLLPKK